MRRVGREGAEGVVDLRRLVQLAQYDVHDFREAYGVVVYRGLKPHVDTGSHTEPLDRRRRDDVDLRLRELRRYRVDLGDERGELLVWRLALSPRVERDDERGDVFAFAAEDVMSVNVHHAVHAGKRHDLLDHRLDDGLGARTRSSFRKLYAGEYNALVLVGKEGRRRKLKHRPAAEGYGREEQERQYPALRYDDGSRDIAAR